MGSPPRAQSSRGGAPRVWRASPHIAYVTPSRWFIRVYSLMFKVRLLTLLLYALLSLFTKGYLPTPYSSTFELKVKYGAHARPSHVRGVQCAHWGCTFR